MNIRSSDPDRNLLRDLIERLGQLPPHDENRFETVDGLDNPGCTNGMRAAFTTEALEVFQNACHMREEPDVAAADLIGDLLHLVHSQGHNPEKVLEAGLTNFVAEAG
jgi:hypothetical protein